MIGFPTSIASVLVCLGGAGIVLACTPPATLLLFDSADGRYGLLQKLCAVELCETPIERPEWQVACLAGGLEHETVGKAGRGSFPELLQSRSHDVGILKRQVFVIEQHLDGGGDLLGGAFIHSVENPSGFHED
jgi:hypothetical protein